MDNLSNTLYSFITAPLSNLVKNLLNSFVTAPETNSTNKTDTNIDKNRYNTRRTDKETDIRIDSQVTEIRIGTHKPTRTKRHTNERLAGYEKRFFDDREKYDQELWNRYSIASDKDPKFLTK